MRLHCGSHRCAFLTTVLLWTSLSLCSATYVQKNTTNTPGYTLLQGISSVPAPLTVAPDQGWAGIDGSWNTFSLRAGSQQTIIRVLPSTSSQQIWVVDLAGCTGTFEDTLTNTTVTKVDEACRDSRGQLFNVTNSKSWYDQGFWDLWVGRDNFGLTGHGHYGYDTVALGIPGEEGPSVDNTTIGTLKNPNFWLGHLGLHPKPTNWSTDVSTSPPVPSYMTMLYEQGNIPGRSYGFTAGSQYRTSPNLE
jgi:hypothetical protein